MRIIKPLIFSLINCVFVFSSFAQENITLVGKLPITGLPIHDVWGYTDTNTGKQYALLCASTSGLRIIDVTDPSSPILTGSISGNGIQAIDVKTWKNYAYIVAESPSVSGKIIDLSDPSAPVQAGTFPGGHNITISNSGFMYLSAPGIRIFDLNDDLLNPTLVYTDNSCNGHDISIVGQTLYDFSDNCGTRIFDIGQPDTLVLLGTVPPSGIFHHSGWPSMDGNYLFICDELASPAENDITVWDISDITSPVLVDSFSDPNAYVHNLYVEENYAFVSYYRAGFRVFNVANPTNISLTSEYDTDSLSSGPGYGGNFGLYTFWGANKILASDEENGLYIFSFTGLNTGLSDSENSEIQDVWIYPNPSNNEITVQLSSPQTEVFQITIADINGKVLQSETVPANENRLIKTYLLSTFSDGTYFISLESNNKVTTKKIILTR